MSHTVKHTRTDAVCAGRRFKRLQHKRERAQVRLALCAGVDANFRCTVRRTYITGAGKLYRRDAIPAALRQ